MSSERILDVGLIVSNFLISTCRLRPQPNKYSFDSGRRCAEAASQHPTHDEEADYIPLTTGSVAEFYIEPMLPHVGDIDFMYHENTKLAIPKGEAPPTQLPAEFHNYVKAYEIVHSRWPGYVYLELRYLLTECPEKGKYSAVEYDKGNYHPSARYPVGCDTHGPAHRQIPNENLLPIDTVPCVRCLSWPPQAAEWPTRHRNIWPDSETVDRVVSSGCDVVGVAHHEIQDKLNRTHQWRLSFSRSEIVLINSWIPVQQIVYHMVRVFMKTERLTDSAVNFGARTVSNYHIFLKH